LRQVKKDGCWEYHDGAGYGKARWGGRTERAHRVSFFLANGFWPEVVMHTCDNPSCVNPEHLRAGDHADNVRDALAKGRLHTKLTRELVRQIRHVYAEGTKDQAQLADIFGVTRSAISQIVNRKTWRHA
jgi:predicted XRE-type DNA-binding protein